VLAAFVHTKELAACLAEIKNGAARVYVSHDTDAGIEEGLSRPEKE
jgi:hypothetical protein